MRKKPLFIAAILVTALIAIGASIVNAGSQKVEICHFPPGNPDNYHTITVSENAIQAHLDHGDWPGSCNALCDRICNDDDECTIDHYGNCEEDGCAPFPRAAVECDDQDLCTDDSCNSVSGCVNTPKDCDDEDLCTVDTCDSETGDCVNTPVACPGEEACDPETGQCEATDPCDGVVCDEGYTCIDGECIEGSAKNLLGPDTNLDCSGSPVGYTTVVDLGASGLRVDVEFTNGPANYGAPVYWVCTNVPGGCHGVACGFINLGTVTTNSSGQGFFSTDLPAGNPYPGKYVHFDIGPPWYTSITHLEIFPSIGSLTLSTESLSDGRDPTN